MDAKVADLPLTDKLWAWFETNKKPVVGVVVAAAVVGLVTWFILWQREEKANAAGDALSSVLVSQWMGAGARPETVESAQAYLKVASAYPKSNAGERALLLAADSFFVAGNYAEAQAQFEKAARDYRDSPLRPQALLGIAASLNAQGKTDAAIAAYKELLARHTSASVIPQAKFSLACLYEAQQKLELARDLFLEVERDDRVRSLSYEASTRLQNLLDKNPRLAPSTQVPAKPTLQLPSK